MLVSDFNFHLPDDLIAQEPLAARDASRMLHLQRTGGHADRLFRDFPDLLRPGDLLVFNNTRVFPARLYGRREGARAHPVSPRNPAARDFLHGRIEVLLTRQLSTHPNDWECLVRPGRKIGVGERLFFGERDELQAEVLARGEFGVRHIRFEPVFAAMTISSLLSIASATFHSRLISRAPILPAIANAIKPSMPSSADR